MRTANVKIETSRVVMGGDYQQYPDSPPNVRGQLSETRDEATFVDHFYNIIITSTSHAMPLNSVLKINNIRMINTNLKFFGILTTPTLSPPMKKIAISYRDDE